MSKSIEGPSTFNVVVLVRPGKDLKEVEKAVYAELDRVKSEPIADWELKKVHMLERHQTAQELQSTLYRAYVIGEMAVIYGDPNLINTRFGKIQSVSKEDIQRVAKTYLTEDNRTVVTTLPKPKAETAQSPQLGVSNDISIPNPCSVVFALIAPPRLFALSVAQVPAGSRLQGDSAEQGGAQE